MQCIFAGMYLKKISEDSTLMVLINLVDIGGKVPKYIFNKVAIEQPV